MASGGYNYDRPWERQPFDTDQSWALFQEYLIQGSPRTTKRIARPGLGMSWTQIETLAWEDGWAIRARRYDEHIDNLRQTTIEREVIEDAKAIARRHARGARKAFALAELELDRLLTAAQRSDVHGLISVRDASRLMFIGAKIERLVTGESTEAVAVQTDLSGLSLEELRELRKMQLKTGTPV